MMSKWSRSNWSKSFFETRKSSLTTLILTRMTRQYSFQNPKCRYKLWKDDNKVHEDSDIFGSVRYRIQRIILGFITPIQVGFQLEGW